MDLLVNEWTAYQKENSKKILRDDGYDFDVDKIKYVGGLDISFNKDDKTDNCAYITIIDYQTDEIVYEDYEKVNLTVPYISGFLGFREVPVYTILLNRLKLHKPKYYPDVLLIDGFGVLHHREFGSASHLGLVADIPTIGVAKTMLYHDGLDEKLIKKEFESKCKSKGDYIELVGTSGTKYGVALRSTNETTNPIYVSIGHKIGMKSTIKIVSKLCQYRIPEPIRISDIKSRKLGGHVFVGGRLRRRAWPGDLSAGQSAQPEPTLVPAPVRHARRGFFLLQQQRH